MFDSQTAQLIRHAPALSELDMERLPQRLAQAFTAIVAFRVRMGQAGTPLPDQLRAELDNFRRMANTFEALVILLPARENRAAAAYVAAQAHHLVIMARQLERPEGMAERHLRAEAISSTVSALLLFLIADQPSDAMELAKIIRSMSETSTRDRKILDRSSGLVGGGKASVHL